MVTIGSKQNDMDFSKISKGSSCILSDMLAAYPSGLRTPKSSE